MPWTPAEGTLSIVDPALRPSIEGGAPGILRGVSIVVARLGLPRCLTHATGRAFRDPEHAVPSGSARRSVSGRGAVPDMRGRPRGRQRRGTPQCGELSGQGPGADRQRTWAQSINVSVTTRSRIRF